MPLETKLLPRVQSAVSLAKQVDRATHTQSREKSNKKARLQMARDMDLPTDSDEASDSDDEPRDNGKLARQRAQQLKQAEGQKAQLAQLLKKLSQPIGMSVQQLAREQAHG